MTKFLAFFEHLEKTAYGPEAMGQVFKRFKQVQLKNPAVNAFMGGMGGKKGLRDSLAAARRSGATEEMLEGAMPAIEDQFKALRPGPTTFTPVRGDGINFLKAQGIDEAIEGMGAAGIGGGAIKPEAFKQVAQSPGNRRALDAVLKGHELAETQVKATNSFMGFGHRSPEVLLREHNMIQTLPKENAPVADLMRSMRAPGETTALAQTTGFQYGQGPRLSRHARKHITRMHDDEAHRLLREQQG